MAGFRLLAIVRSILVAGGLCVAALASIGTPASAAPVTADETVAFELFRMEAAAGSLPPELEGRLRAVLNDAHASLGSNPRPPTSAAEFLSFAERVSISLARHNFIQPVLKADWVDSLGRALQPVSATHPNLRAYLNHSQNAARRPYLDATRPYYFLDCDMGALLLMSVAQMVGFELNLVEVPSHNFVRWSDGSGGKVNWDWTNWGSYPDTRYIQSHAISPVQLLRRTFLGSQTAAESRGYFIGVMTINLSDPAAVLRLRRLAIAAAPNNPTTANNVAWSFATIATGVTDDERTAAVAFSLSAVASKPGDANYLDTLGCAYAAAGNRRLGAAIEEQAIADAGADDVDGYRRNLARIRNGELCQ